MGKAEDKRPGEHWDGRLRISSTYDTETFDMLDRLAMACGISRTTLQGELVKVCLQNESMINYIQERYRHRSRFRIIPSKQEGKIKFILVEKK